MADDSLELTVGDNSLELEVNPPYVGSAFSPEVDIEETTSTITVTITDARGEHSYSVPNTDSAITDAEAATAAATSAASAATSAASAAGTATTAANNAANAATSAASGASIAAALANEKAGVAVQAASDANSAAEVASAKATLANTAATAANAAASAAGNAASAATSAADYADIATRDASAAADAANSAADAANAAAAAAESATGTVDAAVASANAAASYANEKGGLASNAANAANSAASSATSAASAANSAASTASMAATSADNKASAANTAAGAANTAATAATSAASAANTAAEAANTAAEYASEFTEAYLPMVTAGVSESLLATDVTVDTFAQRVSDHDGGVRIESLRGNTVRWNQLVPNNYTITINNTIKFTSGDKLTSGHKYLLKSDIAITSPGTSTPFIALYASPNGKGERVATVNYTNSGRNCTFFTSLYDGVSNGTDSPVAGNFWLYDALFNAVATITNTCLFDLTEAFGAGNEPATVEEFERQYPESYYPYDAGSLLSVNIEGIKTVGKNLLDPLQCTPKKYVSKASGVIGDSNGWSASGFIEVTSGYSYVFSGVTNTWSDAAGTAFYDVDKTFISSVSSQTYVLTPPPNAKYMRISFNTEDVSLIQVEVGTVATSYKPYRAGVTREIPAATYFPNGMRSAGSVYDELTSDKAITRIGAVDVSTLSWEKQTTSGNNRYRAIAPGVKPYGNTQIHTDWNTNLPYTNGSAQDCNNNDNTMCLGGSSSETYLYLSANVAPSVESLITALDGYFIEFILNTPTEAAIDPPLNLAYPVEQGGAESIVIPTGEMSAAPTMAVVYAYNADGVRDISQAIIANIEGNTASTNYAIGGYFVHAGKLYRATSAIATGETIRPGTNCTQTTVMAELIRLTA